jgi:glucose/arabinose dehydrogenase
MQRYIYSILLFSALVQLVFPSHGQTSTQKTIERVTVVDRLIRPWDIVFLDNSQALVSEKEGGVQWVNLLTGEKQLLKGLPADAEFRNKTGIGDNTGYFGIALDPNFAKNHWVYLAYAATNSAQDATTTKVIRAKYKNFALSNIQSLLVAEPFSTDRYHYGGGLVFGADNKLYITVGERLFTEKDQPTNMPIAQNLQDKRGKIYRINPDGSIPNDNPTFSESSVPGLYALGIRAAQGLTLHPKTGQIWFSEHGTYQGDEINQLQAGANYGWPIITSGKYRFAEYAPPDLTRTFAAPSWFWENTVAPTGLTFYFGDEFPQWHGHLLVPGLSRGNFWLMNIKDNKIVAAEELFTDKKIRLRKAKQAPDGKLYLLTDEANGRILRVVNQSADD